MMHASILFRVSSFHLRAHQWWSVPLFFCLLPPQQGELKKSVHSPSLYLHSMSLLPKMSEESNGLFLLQLPFLPHGFIVLFRFFGVGDQANVSKERKQQRRRGSGLFFLSSLRESWLILHFLLARAELWLPTYHVVVWCVCWWIPFHPTYIPFGVLT